MRIWRATHVGHARAAWTGEGAARRGGRWNSAGRPVVYASEHAALALVEVLAYVPPQAMGRFRLTSATLDEALVSDVTVPPGWDAYPHTAASKGIGDAWLSRRDRLALRVPSSLVPGTNVLVDPAHPEFRRLEIDPEVFEIPFGKRVAGLA